jgi:CelD/BcsL family acetyltransferase involved in cellulose biosynthesis
MIELGCDIADSLTREQPTVAKTAPDHAAGLPAGLAGIIGDYQQLADTLPAPAPQSPAWIKAWFSQTGADGVFVVLRDQGKPVGAAALEIVKAHGMTIARFAGGSHANGNLLPFDGDCLPEPRDRLPAMLRDAVRFARPDIDLIVLERQLPQINGRPNPFIGQLSSPTVHVALSADLSGGFDELLGRLNGKRKRKKHRGQRNKLEAAGGYRLLEARSAGEINAMLDAFLAMKAERFAAMGIRNVFGDRQTIDFFRTLFLSQAGSAKPRFFLKGLEVGGNLRAVDGFSVSDQRLTIEFGSFRSDELARASPGEFMAYEFTRQAAESGFSIYDYSVGDEPYKRQWCDIETWYVDSYLPVSVRGAFLARVLLVMNRAKRTIRTNPTLWRAIRGIKRRFSKSESPAAEADTES